VHPADVALATMNEAFAGQVLDPSAQRLAPFQQNDAHSSLGQFRRAGQSGRAAAEDHHFGYELAPSDGMKNVPGAEAGPCGPERASITDLPALARY